MRTTHVAAGLALLVSCAGLARAGESVEEQIAAVVARNQVVRFLTDREFELDSDEVTATATAVEPDKNVEVEIDDFVLTGNRVSLDLQVKARMAAAGHLNDREDEQVEATVDLDNTVSVVAEFMQVGEQLQVRAKVHKWKVQCEVVELDPADTKIDKRVIERLLESHNDEFVRQMNDWLQENIEVDTSDDS